MSRTIEVCSCTEWICDRLLSDLGLDSCWKEEAATEWHGAVCDRLERELHDVVATRPDGERILFHGWNGENKFHHKGCGLGTFDDFTDEEWDKAEEIAREVADVVLARYEELERSELSD